MEFNQIRYFLAVAETLNFTRAAETCAVSQPALSKAIRKLEDTLGADLLDRDSQGVALTDFGRTMLVHFEHIESVRRKARDAAKLATKTTVERLNVGVMCTIGPHRFNQFLKDFYLGHPLIELTLHDVPSSAIPDLLLSGGLDCVFCARDDKEDSRFQVVNLFEEKLVVAFAENHRFNDFEDVSLAEVSKEVYLDRLHCEFRVDFFNITRARGLDLKVALRSEREDWILELIHSGLGVSIIPESSVIMDTLTYRPVSDLKNLRKLELMTASNVMVSPVLVAFMDAAREFDWRSGGGIN